MLPIVVLYLYLAFLLSLSVLLRDPWVFNETCCTFHSSLVHCPFTSFLFQAMGIIMPFQVGRLGAYRSGATASYPS